MDLPRFDEKTNPMPFDAVRNPKGARTQNNTGMHRNLIRNRRDGRGKGVVIAGNKVTYNPRPRELPQAGRGGAVPKKDHPGQPWINAHQGDMTLDPEGRERVGEKDLPPFDAVKNGGGRGLPGGRPALPGGRPALPNFRGQVGQPLSRLDSMDPKKRDLFEQQLGWRDKELDRMNKKIAGTGTSSRVNLSDKKFYTKSRDRMLAKTGGDDPLDKFLSTGSIFNKKPWQPSQEDLFATFSPLADEWNYGNQVRMRAGRLNSPYS